LTPPHGGFVANARNRRSTARLAFPTSLPICFSFYRCGWREVCIWENFKSCFRFRPKHNNLG
jgi:hypothetical protein